MSAIRIAHNDAETAKTGRRLTGRFPVTEDAVEI
jgi:hypothetical protein